MWGAYSAGWVVLKESEFKEGKPDFDKMTQWNSYQLVVIGNIFENKNLLKKE
jgi:hypothetical protein